MQPKEEPRAERRKRGRSRKPRSSSAASEGIAQKAPAAPAGGAPTAASDDGQLDDPRAAVLRWPLVGAAAAAATGVALVGTGSSPAGMWMAVAGGVGLVVSIHRLGRLGPP